MLDLFNAWLKVYINITFDFILLVARLQDDVSSAVPWRSVQSNAALLAVQPRGAAQVLRPATRPQCHQKEVMTSSRRPKQKSLLNYMDGADGGLNTCVSIQLKKKKKTPDRNTHWRIHSRTKSINVERCPALVNTEPPRQEPISIYQLTDWHYTNLRAQKLGDEISDLIYS